MSLNSERTWQPEVATTVGGAKSEAGARRPAFVPSTF